MATSDAEYKMPRICKQIFDDGRIPSLPHKRSMTKKGNYHGMNMCVMNTIIVHFVLWAKYFLIQLLTEKAIESISRRKRETCYKTHPRYFPSYEMGWT